MGRLLLGLVLLAVSLYAVKWFRQKNKNNKIKSLPSANLVQCAVCHAYVEEQRALNVEGQYFCTKQHQQQHKQD